MSEEVEEKRGPGRPRTVREEETEAPRRRRSADVGGGTNSLAVPESLLDRSKYEYRWIKDEGVRLYNLTVLDDYDVVSKDVTSKAAKVEGEYTDAFRVQVGMKADGSGPLFQYLCRKPKKYADADRKGRQKANDEVIKARVKADRDAVLADKGQIAEDKSTMDAQDSASLRPPENDFR